VPDAARIEAIAPPPPPDAAVVKPQRHQAPTPTQLPPPPPPKTVPRDPYSAPHAKPPPCSPFDHPNGC
jgi:hypothetical protein